MLSWWLHDLQNLTVNNVEKMHWTKQLPIKPLTNQVLFFKTCDDVTHFSETF